MHAAAPVQHRVFIGVVRRAALGQGGHERGLPRKARSRNNNRPAPPAHDTGVHEHPGVRHLGDVELDIRLKGVHDVINVTGPREPKFVGIREVKSADSTMFALGVASDYRVETIDDRVLGCLPAWGRRPVSSSRSVGSLVRMPTRVP